MTARQFTYCMFALLVVGAWVCTALVFKGSVH